MVSQGVDQVQIIVSHNWSGRSIKKEGKKGIVAWVAEIICIQKIWNNEIGFFYHWKYLNTKKQSQKNSSIWKHSTFIESSRSKLKINQIEHMKAYDCKGMLRWIVHVTLIGSDKSSM